MVVYSSFPPPPVFSAHRSSFLEIMPPKFKRVANTSHQVLASLSERPSLRLVSETAVQRRPYASQDANIVVSHQGLVYTQDGVYSHVGGTGRLLSGRVGGSEKPDSGATIGVEVNVVDEQRVAKNQRLWYRWKNEVIPTMIKPLLGLLHKTTFLRDIDSVRQTPGCKGCLEGRLLPIYCVFFDSSYIFFLGIWLKLCLI